MGMLDNVAKEDPAGEGGDYLGEGTHTGVIEAVKLINTPVNGEAIVVEVKITESTDEKSVDKVKSVMYMDKYLAAKKAFKRMVMDVTGCSEEESKDVTMLQDIVGELQPMKGIVVEIKSFEIRTKSDKPFTKHNWSLVEKVPA